MLGWSWQSGEPEGSVSRTPEAVRRRRFGSARARARQRLTHAVLRAEADEPHAVGVGHRVARRVVAGRHAVEERGRRLAFGGRAAQRAVQRVDVERARAARPLRRREQRAGVVAEDLVRQKIARLLHEHQVAGRRQRTRDERQAAGVTRRREEASRVAGFAQLLREVRSDRGGVVRAPGYRAVLQQVPSVKAGEVGRRLQHERAGQQGERRLTDAEVEDVRRLRGALPRRQRQRRGGAARREEASHLSTQVHRSVHRA
eukprot:5580333-Prymnesium_polylepis.1